MKSKTKFALAIVCTGLWTYSPSFAAITYPAPPPWQPDPEQREHLRRSLTLLQSSTPADRKTVRVLFYGQSITQQAWWKELANYLRSTYTNANLVIENRAIGGHASQLLVKTAEADLYPFQPDLLIFHVYGSHIEYENIIRRVRERTCADILLQTDHLTSDASLTEETDPAKLSPAKWDPWMNHVFLPATAAKYGACRADIHELWKGYLKAHQLKAADLLKDSVHLNAQGEWLMAELLKAYLAPLAPKAGYDPLNEARVHTVPMPSSVGPGTLRLEFTGTRADLIFKPSAKAGLSVLVDGKSPSAIPELYGFSRVSAFPMSDWPVLLKVGSVAPLVAEDWSLKIDQSSPDGKCCHFTLRGNVTGEDGEGYSTNRFVSKSGRVVIEPDDWNLAFSVSVFKRAWPDNQAASWRAVLRGTDKALPPAAPPGTEACVTLAQNLSSGRHVLELRGTAVTDQIQAIRFYSPDGASGKADTSNRTAPSMGSTAVPVDLSHLLNARVVITQKQGRLQLADHALDHGNSILITRTAAEVSHAGQLNPLPDSGLVPANERHPEVKLDYADGDGGAQVRQMSARTESIDVAVPEKHYRQMQAFFISANGPTPVSVTLHYAEGTAQKQTTLIPDFFFLPTRNDTGWFVLVDNFGKVDREGKMTEQTHHYIHGLDLNPDPNKVLQRVELTKENSGSVLNLFNLTGTVAADTPAPFMILVFSKTTGYRHASISNGIAAIRELGAQHNFAVDATEDSSAFTKPNLARYQALVLLSVTGDVFNPEQEGALRDYILGGGGLAAIHGAIFGPLACEEKWDWYGELFCCAFTNHSTVLPATINVEDTAHPSMAGLPLHWQRTDEWYNFSGSPRGCARVLATMDESTYVGGKMGGDHPIAWCRRLGQGRMWYTALGHTESSFSEPLFRQHLLGGIRVAAGQAAADFAPNMRSDKP